MNDNPRVFVVDDDRDLGASVARLLQRRAPDAVDAPATGMASLWRTHRLIDGWLWPLLIPIVAAAVGFFATRWAALRMVREGA